MEVKQTIESTEESRKTETLSKIESKLTVAEQKREKEIQRKLENIKLSVSPLVLMLVLYAYLL